MLTKSFRGKTTDGTIVYSQALQYHGNLAFQCEMRSTLHPDLFCNKYISSESVGSYFTPIDKSP